MQLKTFNAPSMAEALAQVKRELGPDAVIIHTRATRVGGILGLGSRNAVEVTASSDDPRPRITNQTVARQTARQTQGVQRTAIGTYAPNTARPAAQTPQRPAAPARTGAPPVRPEPPVVRVPPRTPASSPRPAEPPIRAHTNGTHATPPTPHTTPEPASNDALQTEIAALRRMMGDVLRSTQQTALSIQSNQASALGALPEPLSDAYRRLLDNELPAELAERLIGIVRDELRSDELADREIVRQTLLRRIEDLIPTRLERPGKSTGRARRIALVGPTGVGKTTSVAKLAASYKLRYGLTVGLLTCDTYRIAAVDQLRTYAGIIDLPLEVATTPDEVRNGLENLEGCDAVFVDTAGRSQHDARRIDELTAIANAVEPDETHLVLASTASLAVLAKIAERFTCMSPDRILLTKLDEAVTFGVLAALPAKVGLPVGFVTMGQEVPDDIEPARADRLARLVLDGVEGEP